MAGDHHGNPDDLEVVHVELSLRCPLLKLKPESWETGVRVGDDQLHAVQAGGLERAQEPGPDAPLSLSPTSKPRTSRGPSPPTRALQ
jgi:hypothetical protein